MATTVQAWREASKPDEVTLPSGNVALLKPVSLLELVMIGLVPQTLVVGMRDINEKTLLDNPGKLAELQPVLNGLAQLAFVEPKVGKTATETQLGIDEVSMADKLFVFSWCNRRAQPLRPFRSKQDGDVEPVPDGQDVREQAE